MQEGFVLFYVDFDRDICRRLLVYTDETLALETFMSLTVEEMYAAFCGCVDDELDIRTPEEIAKDIWYSDSLWQVARCPIHSTTNNKYERKTSLEIRNSNL